MKSGGGRFLVLALLGNFSARGAAGEPLTISSKKNRALLAYLALSHDLTVPRETIAGLLWSDRSDEQARSSLRQSIAVLRKELGAIGPETLHVSDDHIAFRAGAFEADVLEFQRLSGATDKTSLGRAAALYRGELLADLAIRDNSFEEWLRRERSRLKATAIQAVGRLAALETGPARIAVAQQLLALDTLRESSHRVLMQTYAEQGENGLALRQYEICKNLLHTELGVEPAGETQDLRRIISSGRPPAAPAVQPFAPAPGPLLEKPAIAVLPFTNMSSDPEQEYFSDGITEDIITELSRFKNLFVIARNTSFAYKGKAAAVQMIARELGVAYVLEGSVRRAGNRVRITAQLVNAENGVQLWTERYDRELSDIFAVQDEVALGIAGMLAIGMEDETLDRARRKMPENVLAYEHWLRGKRLSWTAGSANLEARRHFENAARADPNYSRAYSGISITYQLEAQEYPAPADFKSGQENALRYAKMALALDEFDHVAHMAVAFAFLYLGDYERMKGHVERTRALNPNDSDTMAQAVWLLAMYGEGDEAVRTGEAAMRLNPRHPEWYYSVHSDAMFTARRYAEALEFRMRSADTYIDSRFLGAAILAHLGREAEARRWAEIAVARLAGRPAYRAGGPDKCVQLVLDNNPFRLQEDRDRLAEGLRRAGVPG